MTDEDPDDEQPTPRPHVPTESERMQHYAAYPPGTPVADLVEQDLQRRIRAVERTQESQGRDLASLTASRRMWRWIVGLGAPVLLTSLFAFVLSSADKISIAGERTGETRAKIEALDKRVEALDKRIDSLQRDINTLILELRKLSGEPRPSVGIVAATAP